MYISGRHAVLEAIKAGERIEKVYLLYGTTGEGVATVRQRSKQAGIPCTTLDREKFKKLERSSGIQTRSQGIIARLQVLDFVEIQDVISTVWEQGEVPLIVALDGITDPHNLGAIIRSVECAGGHALMFPRSKSSGISEVVVKSSAGAVHHLPLARVDHLSTALQSLSQSGLRRIGLDERGTTEYTDIDWRDPTVLVVGSEGEGISQHVASQCDAIVSIPMAGEIASLNASVAAGVVLFEAARQRRIGSRKDSEG